MSVVKKQQNNIQCRLSDIQEHQLILADKLRQRRETHEKKLQAQQEKDREELLKNVDKSTSAADIQEVGDKAI